MGEGRLRSTKKREGPGNKVVEFDLGGTTDRGITWKVRKFKLLLSFYKVFSTVARTCCFVVELTAPQKHAV